MVDPRPLAVLVVVADAALLRLLKLYLSRAPRFAFTFESDPAAALQRIETQSFEVLVVDDQVPEIGSLALASAARRRWAGTANVLLVGCDVDRMDAEIDARVEKPFYVPALLTLLDRITTSRRPGAELASP